MTAPAGGDSLQTLAEAAARLETAWGEAGYRSAEATGIAMDNPNNPSAAVAVHDGQITYIGISDPLLGIGAEQLTDLINGLIVVAFSNWRARMVNVR